MRLREFIHPSSLAEARAALKEASPDGLPLAGGTALGFMQNRVPGVAVDLMRLGLSHIRAEGQDFSVGATTTLAELQVHRAPGWALHEICRLISTQQIRNASTIGGNISRVFPWCDLPVALLALEARMVVLGEEELELGADQFFAGQPARRLVDGTLLTAVKVPALTRHQGLGTVKMARNLAAFSLVTVVARLTLSEGQISGARVAAGGALPFPRRLPLVEEALLGREAVTQVFEEAAARAGAEGTWTGREGCSPDYATTLAKVSIVDALERAALAAKGRDLP